ncbi:hypothetical protein T310_7225 [Rasamsonia emersonii CBS 393.64]|uniref:Uncharacterized protein n=1 Tax=Rasamsonia emersonii (strain ATCC 16479 / CBS 393.64 / IMI 116815) TaxID=1408163 RepID=A0A0F4YLT3_RASE3|nr:hypothetical protein T310_7225 [Rasamsonia emersonii CBS 393.64]KKA18816.1 hypothetical protein T310_7225 [Rasamsonia emersonii CBS 393.64]
MAKSRKNQKTKRDAATASAKAAGVPRSKKPPRLPDINVEAANRLQHPPPLHQRQQQIPLHAPGFWPQHGWSGDPNLTVRDSSRDVSRPVGPDAFQFHPSPYGRQEQQSSYPGAPVYAGWYLKHPYSMPSPSYVSSYMQPRVDPAFLEGLRYPGHQQSYLPPQYDPSKDEYVKEAAAAKDYGSKDKGKDRAAVPHNPLFQLRPEAPEFVPNDSFTSFEEEETDTNTDTDTASASDSSSEPQTQLGHRRQRSATF